MVTVNVGDLVYDTRSYNRGLGVVFQVLPNLQVADVMEDTDGIHGLRLAMPGTMTPPLEVVGSLPLSNIARGLVNNSDMGQLLGYETMINTLRTGAALGPIEVEKIAHTESDQIQNIDKIP